MLRGGLRIQSQAAQALAARTCGSIMQKPTVFAPKGTRTAASEKELKERMASVTNIQKITSAMKMVAQSGLKSSEAAMKNSKPLSDVLEGFMTNRVQPIADAQEGAAAAKTEAPPVILALSGDKGLCGGINSAITKKTKIELEKLHQAGVKDVVIACIGDKTRGALMNTAGNKIAISVNEFGKRAATFLQVSLAVDEIRKATGDGEITLIHNYYINAASYDQTVRTLPSPAFLLDKIVGLGATFEFEGDDEEEVIENLAEFNIASTVYAAQLTSAAAEQSARVAAMENASKNAGEMFASIQLLYNRTRQASITTELIEIISGAEALKG